MLCFLRSHLAETSLSYHRDLGEGYAEEAIRYTSDKPYSLRRERQIVMRYEAPDFREVHHSEYRHSEYL